MVPQHTLANWKSRLHSSIPILGPRQRRAAVREMLAQRNAPEVVPLLVEALASSDPDVRAVAEGALTTLTDQAAIDALCAAWHDTPSEKLLRLITGSSYAPSDSALAARIALQMGDIQSCLRQDTSLTVLADAFLRNDGGLQNTVRKMIAEGEPRLVGFLGTTVPFASLSEADQRLGLDALASAGHWQSLFDACRTLPLRRGMNGWDQLLRSGWQPTTPREQEIWNSILPPLRSFVACRPMEDLGGDRDATGRRGPPILHRMGIRCLSFSPDGALVATAGQDGLLRLWSTESAGLIGQPMQHDSFVDWAGFTPDGQRLISTSNLIARIHIWDPGMGQEVVPSIDTGGKLWVTPPAISGDGQRIIAGVAFATTGNTLDHFRCSIQMWAIQNGQRLFASSPWFGYSGYGFSVDGRYVAGGSMPASEIAVLNLTSGKEVRRPGLDDDLCNVAFEPQSRFFAGTIKRRAFLWSTDTAEQICGPLDHDGNVEQLLISPNGQVMACSTRSSISFWSIPEGRRLGDPIPFRCGGYHGMRFFPDGRHLAAFGERSKTVCFWDSATGNQFATPLVHDDPVARFAISPNGRLIATVTAKEPKTALGESAAFIWSLKADLLAVWPSRTSASELTEMERQLKTAGINDCDRAAMEILKILAQNT